MLLICGARAETLVTKARSSHRSRDYGAAFNMIIFETLGTSGPLPKVRTAQGRLQTSAGRVGRRMREFEAIADAFLCENDDLLGEIYIHLLTRGVVRAWQGKRYLNRVRVDETSFVAKNAGSALPLAA